MNYEQALEYIHARRGPSERSRNLERFSALLELIGNPHKKLRYAHISGSSGKGSTAAMLESVLRRAGYKTGLFVSPFVYDFRERIQINGELSPKLLICDALDILIPALERMKAEGMECTEFDVVTALAFLIFEREKCEIVVLEVGIGGLHDRTNVISAPEVAVICSISLEHTELLGKTITEIAKHKCGIIKPGCRVAAYPALCADALNVLNSTCETHKIAPEIADLNALSAVTLHKNGSDFAYGGEQFFVSLAGEYQIMNALTVISAIRQLRYAGFDISPDALKNGLANTQLVGRMQTVRQSPDCIVDGAHNPEKIAGLCSALDSLYAGKRIISIMGMKADKDYAACIPLIARRSAVYIATTPPDMGGRALDTEVIAEIARQYCTDVRICADAYEAARLAVRLAGENDVALACGSMYISGDARRGFLAES